MGGVIAQVIHLVCFRIVQMTKLDEVMTFGVVMLSLVCVGIDHVTRLGEVLLSSFADIT